MAAWTWISGGSFYAARWREWLADRRAPALDAWAETADERDPLTGRDGVSYRLPSTVPPSDDEAREALYDHIRTRLGMPTSKSEAA